MVTNLSRRVSLPTLRPFVDTVWWSRSDHAGGVAGFRHEHVLPTGAMHLALRLGDAPLLRVADERGVLRRIGHAVLGGPRAGHYLKQVDAAVCVGAQLRPGAARALFGESARMFCDQHIELGQLWGDAVSALRERLGDEREPARCLERFEQWLAARLMRHALPHPAVMAALSVLRGGGRVDTAVAEGGCSHRRLLTLFEDAVGLTPKRYARVVRLQRVLTDVQRDPRGGWCQRALMAGFSDQAHLTREFRMLAGMTPERYRLARPVSAHHVAVD